MRASPFSKESASLSKVRFCKNLPPKSARLGRSLTTLRPWRKGESEARGASQSIWGLDRAMFFLQKSSHVSPHPPIRWGKNGHLVVKWFFINYSPFINLSKRKRVGGNFGWLSYPTQPAYSLGFSTSSWTISEKHGSKTCDLPELGYVDEGFNEAF